MDRNAYRDGDDTDQPDAYWRRRVITLAVGLALLGVLAWAFSGSGGQAARPAAKTSTPGTTITPAAAYGSASSAGVPSLGASATASAGTSTGTSAGALGGGLSGQGAGRPRSALTSGTGMPGTGSAGTGSIQSSSESAGRKTPAGSSGTSTKGPASVLPGGCAPSAVVLSLFTSRPEYSGQQDPRFSIDAVSTASAACTFGVGPAKLQVIVMSSGRIIWDSTDCAKGVSGRTEKLKRGVPVLQRVTWNRSVSLPGCVTLASSARAGTYQVRARSGGVSSPVRTFKLDRLTAPLGPASADGAQNGREGLPDVLHLLHLDVVGQPLSSLQGPA